MKTISILPATLTTVTGGSVPIKEENTREMSIQATVAGTGALTASIIIEVSNDNRGWVSNAVSNINLSGTTVASQGLLLKAPWAYIRARVTSISGTGASVTVTAGA